MRAAIYIRVSTVAQGERTSLESQLAACQEYAQRHGDDVVRVFRDMDSGADETIPGFLELADVCQSGAVDRVIIDHPDRLSRSLLKKVMFRAQLAKTGVDVRYVHLPLEDTAEGRLTENMFAALAEYDRERIAFRNARGRRAKAARGLIVGNGWAPYGYQFTRDGDGRIIGLEPTEQALIVRHIFELARTSSAMTIAEQLTADGVPTFRGGSSWRDSTISGILTNSTYRGMAAFGKGTADVIEIQCSPIVSQAEWTAAQTARARRRRNHSARMVDDPYLLRGRLSCSYCGRHLACVPINRHRYYQCLHSDRRRAAQAGVPRCPLPYLPASAVEAHIVDRVTTTLLNPNWLKAAVDDTERASERQKRERQGSLHSLERQRDRLRSQIRQTTERLAALPVESERYRAADEHAAALEQSLMDLAARIAELESQPEPETPDSMTMAEYARCVTSEIAAMPKEAASEMIAALDVQGTVRDDPSGEKFGRRYHWAIEWSSAIGILDDARVFKKTRVRFYTPEYDEWERKNLPAGVAS